MLLTLACIASLPASGVEPEETERTLSIGRHSLADAISVPLEPGRQLLPRQLVANGLNNPRGMLPVSSDTLLVALAGRGLASEPLTGEVVLLKDHDDDGILELDETLLERQRSTNIIDLVRRDEVFGMADIASGGDVVLISAAFFGGPSTLWQWRGSGLQRWATVDGNINSIAYSPDTEEWFAVSSSTEQVLQIGSDTTIRELLKIPDLPQGQDPVPGYVHYSAEAGLLVSLFSGSPLGEEGGDGTEIEHRAGGIIRVDTQTGEFGWLVSGLTAPTDLLTDDLGRLYVLEFCSDFVDPLPSREAMWVGPSHGGFRRHSGRLLRIDLDSGEVVVVAEGLDGPTNLALDGNRLFIAQGMGTPGRLVPTAQGAVPLDGFIERLILPADPVEGFELGVLGDAVP